jgi:hypothetical protein
VEEGTPDREEKTRLVEVKLEKSRNRGVTLANVLAFAL